MCRIRVSLGCIPVESALGAISLPCVWHIRLASEHQPELGTEEAIRKVGVDEYNHVEVRCESTEKRKKKSYIYTILCYSVSQIKIVKIVSQIKIVVVVIVAVVHSGAAVVQGASVVNPFAINK